MTKPLNLVKNSFTLLETLISMSLLIIIISGFSYSSYFDNKNTTLYVILNNLENKFNTNDYNSFSKTKQILNITINKTEESTIEVNKYSFKNQDVSIYKYEK
jgi:hypothetical protein